MKRQSKADKLDESLSERRGKESSKKQSYKDRRDESKGSSHHETARKHLEKAHAALSKLHEAEAGRKYNRSAKHRKAESKGMKKAMSGK